jgi:hypothetical protein
MTTGFSSSISHTLQRFAAISNEEEVGGASFCPEKLVEGMAYPDRVAHEWIGKVVS